MYLAIYITVDVVKFGVIDLENRSIIHKAESKRNDEQQEKYQFQEKLALINLIRGLEKFLDHYETKEHPKIKHTIIAIGTTINSYRGLKLEDIKQEKVSEIMQKKGHDSHVSLISDIESLAYGILYFHKKGFLKSDLNLIVGDYPDFIEPKKGYLTRSPDFGKTELKKSLVIGLNTELKIAGIPHGVRWNGFPYIQMSEGGNHTFSPEIELGKYEQINLVKYIQKLQSYEDLLSPRGMQTIYNYFLYQQKIAPNFNLSEQDILSSLKLRTETDQFDYDESKQMSDKDIENILKTKGIGEKRIQEILKAMTKSLESTDSREIMTFITYKDVRDFLGIGKKMGTSHYAMVNTISLVCKILGSFCRNMAQYLNCNDVIFIWSQTLKELELSWLSDAFKNGFLVKGNKQNLNQISVLLINDEHFPLYGCAYYAELYNQKD
ncbi:MAG TPA: hypothetical protein DCF68_00565 [Cyanothece sp. UBA12306]|nr:hypothetical protein [Cyanothece sp. UBA12306]